MVTSSTFSGLSKAGGSQPAAISFARRNPWVHRMMPNTVLYYMIIDCIIL